MIRSLMYLTASVPDIQFSTCLCARSLVSKGSGFDLKAYSDSDYAGCNIDRKSILGGCQILGGKLVCWSEKKQSSVAMSSAEAEYVIAVGCCTQVLWIKSQLTDYDVLYDKSNNLQHITQSTFGNSGILLRNTIELPEGNNVVPLRSNTIQLVQNGCSFHRLRFEDPNQHLKDFLKLVDSLDLNGENKERMHLKDCKTPQQYLDVPTTSRRTPLRIMDSFQGLTPKMVPKTLSTAWKIPNKSLLNMHPRVPTKRENPQNVNNQSNLEGLVSNFMASHDARLSKYEAEFKQQQSEMTNKIKTVLKAITNRMDGALPSDTVKKPKLNVNSSYPVLSALSYLTEDPQCSSHPYNSINAVKKYSSESNHSLKDQPRPVMEIRTQQPEEPENTLEDEFKDLHLNLPLLEVLAHAL
nr:hypothetical protein [Tanacetum cinerariifolium]